MLSRLLCITNYRDGARTERVMPSRRPNTGYLDDPGPESQGEEGATQAGHGRGASVLPSYLPSPYLGSFEDLEIKASDMNSGGKAQG